MKYVKHAKVEWNKAVAPSHEGAWIEIVRPRVISSHLLVAPSHEGAWIEIASRRGRGPKTGVAPSHEGAWIEINGVSTSCA